MNEDNYKFKIIKDKGEFEEIIRKDKKNLSNLQNINNINQLLKENLPRQKKISPLLIILPIFIFLIISSVLIFIFFNQQKQPSSFTQDNGQDEENIYQIFSEIINTSSREENLSQITTEATATIKDNLIIDNETSTQQKSFSTIVISLATPPSKEILQSTPSDLIKTDDNQKKIFSSEIKNEDSINKNITSSIVNEPPSPSRDEILNIKTKEIINQGTSLGLIYFSFPILEIEVKSLNNEGFKNSWLSLMKIQKKAGKIYQIKFIFQNQTIRGDFIKNYFLNPSFFIEEKIKNNFIQSLSDDYQILFYYTHTRKFPILIFKINNDIQTITFMRLWDKETLIKDLLLTLFSGLPKGNPIRNFTLTENYEGIDYKIAYFDNDYKLIWTIYKDYLIISTTLSGFRYIIKDMKNY
ncbi:MAG: hypothetical protein NZ866_00175 [Patescibacteria group bacterium]|nr:hypothetical protein [Patescibacteria group bacterium]